MLEFDHVHFGYGRAVILPDLSFTIEKGDMVALIGANGAGKSTVSRLCNGLLLPSKGHVRVTGMDTKKVRTSALARKIGFLFQNPDRQICKNTVYDELAFGLQVQGVSEAEQKERVEKALETFHLDPKWEPFTRSRGERQRIALASVLIHEPGTDYFGRTHYGAGLPGMHRNYGVCNGVKPGKADNGADGFPRYGIGAKVTQNGFWYCQAGSCWVTARCGKS